MHFRPGTLLLTSPPRFLPLFEILTHNDTFGSSPPKVSVVTVVTFPVPVFVFPRRTSNCEHSLQQPGVSLYSETSMFPRLQPVSPRSLLSPHSLTPILPFVEQVLETTYPFDPMSSTLKPLNFPLKQTVVPLKFLNWVYDVLVILSLSIFNILSSFRSRVHSLPRGK